MGWQRPPAVAGLFYPRNPDALATSVDGYVDAAAAGGRVPKAIIAPHAGYVYSGPIAGSAYARLKPARGTVRLVVLMGPSHTVFFHGLAATSAEALSTPMGDVAVDRDACERALGLPQVSVLDAAHEREHALEVQLPFLQRTLGAVAVVPLVAGEAAAEEVAEVLEILWNGAETLIVVSSDLSHYTDYETARTMNAATSRAIERLDAEAIDGEQACGWVAIRGLLTAARRRGLEAETVDVRNSGDTAGPRDSVVGYGAYVLA